MARSNVIIGRFTVTSQALTQGSTTVDVTNDTLLFTNHGLKTGDGVAFASDTTLPTGISANTKYFVITVDKNNIAIATSAANALANTRVNITATGTGVLTAYKNGFGAIAISNLVPLGCIVTRSWSKAHTAFTSAGSATVSIIVGGITCKTATAFDDAAFVDVDLHDPTDAATTASTALTITSATATLTAGDYTICVELIPA